MVFALQYEGNSTAAAAVAALSTMGTAVGDQRHTRKPKIAIGNTAQSGLNSRKTPIRSQTSMVHERSLGTIEAKSKAAKYQRGCQLKGRRKDPHAHRPVPAQPALARRIL